MTIEKETRELFMSLPTWNARDALRMLLEIDPDSIRLDDDFDGSDIEVEARALIGWLVRYGILPRGIRESFESAPELIADYLDAIGDVRRTPAEWIVAAAANPAAPAEWLESLHAPSGVLEQDRKTNAVTTHFLEPDKGSIPARFVIEVADEMEKNGRKMTVTNVWGELAKRVGKSVIEDTQPDAFLCNVGEPDLYRLTYGAVRGILNRRKKARIAHG